MKHVLACGQALAWVFLLCLMFAVSQAEVDTIRIGDDDWQCQTKEGAKISGHVRVDKALLACAKLTDGDGAERRVQPAGYRVIKVGVSGTATLSWVPPAKNTDGTPATVTAYRIHYGLKPDQLIQAVQIAPAATYTFTGLAPGTYYFAVRAISSTVAESDLSNVASRIVG